MNRHSRIFRLTALLATTSMIASGVLAGAPPARAQDAQAQDVGVPSAGDPPGRVGRLARLDGTVSSHGAGSTQWTPAVLNFPFVPGDSLWTEPRAQADIEIGADLATLADSSELDLASLDDRTLVASEPQGAIFLDLRDVRPGDTYTINTPRGAVQIATDGEYEILAGDTNTPTRVAVVRGAAQFTSGALALRAGPGQMAVASGGQDVQGDVEPLNSYDPFLTAMLARNSVPANVPRAVQGMTGAQGLEQYGSWQQSPEYGQVWYPRVAPDWMPYRDGSWSYVAPWGWTWVDNEPWGFAPFHYGRWAQLDQHWCWVPAEEGAAYDSEPVYAPALVDFVAAGAVAGAAAGLIAASLASGRGDVGWVPLGPREAYDPPYDASRRYRSRLNWGGGWHQASWNDRHGQTSIDNRNVTNTVLVNRRALTVVPAAAMAQSQQIRPVAHGLGTAGASGFQHGAVQSLRGSLPIRPVAETRGLTPRAAQRLGLAEAPRHPAAPGPAINTAAPHPASAPGGRIPFRGATAAAGIPALGHAPGPSVRPVVPVHAPAPPQAPVRPQIAHAMPAATLARPRQPAPGPQMTRPGYRPAEPGHGVGLPPPAPPPAFRAQPVEAPRPVAPRPFAPTAFAPRPFAPRPPAFHAEAPRPAAMPRMEPSRPMMQRPPPQAARPAPRPPGARPDHP